MTGLPLNIDLQQIMIHLFNFTILFGALYILLYKPVKNFMASREAYYADIDTKTASELKAAEDSRRMYDDKVKSFDEEIQTEKGKAFKAIDEEKSRRLSEAKVQAEKIIADAKTEADRQKGEIVSSAQKEIAEMVTDAMEKLTLEQSASEAFDQFLDAAESEMHN